jgi:hypothetical protein
MSKLTPVPHYVLSTSLQDAEATRVAARRNTSELHRPEAYGPKTPARNLQARVAGTKVAGAISVTGGTD